MKKFSLIILLVLTCSCTLRHVGTKYQMEVPVGGYVAGGVGILTGIILSAWSVTTINESIEGDLDFEFGLHNKAALGSGAALFAAGIGTIIGSIVYQTKNTPEIDEGPSPKYLPMKPPLYRSGMYVTEKRSGVEVYIYYYEQSYEYVYGNPGYYKPVTLYNVCSSAGVSAECWWVNEEDLGYE